MQLPLQFCYLFNEEFLWKRMEKNYAETDFFLPEYLATPILHMDFSFVRDFFHSSTNMLQISRSSKSKTLDASDKIRSTLKNQKSSRSKKRKNNDFETSDPPDFRKR